MATNTNISTSGTERVPVIWIIKNSTDATTQVTLTNTSTTETIIWSNALAASYWLKFDGNTGLCYSSTGTTDAAWTDVNRNVTGLPPTVQGGSTNVVTVTGVANGGVLEWAFTPRTIGSTS